MTVLEALNRLPADKWKLQTLSNCFLAGSVKKNSASITFQTTPELVLQTNHAAIVGGMPENIGMVIWVDAKAWEQAKKTKFNSVAKWPEGVGINLGNLQNESHDTHETREQAQAICDRLQREGFGGDGKIFPLSTRVEEVPA